MSISRNFLLIGCTAALAFPLSAQERGPREAAGREAPSQAAEQEAAASGAEDDFAARMGMEVVGEPPEAGGIR